MTTDKAVMCALLLMCVGCHKLNHPYWVGDKTFINGKHCASVTRMDKHLTGYAYVVSDQFKYDIISGGGQSPANEYTDKMMKAEAEDYCATQFAYYGQDGEGTKPADSYSQMVIWTNKIHPNWTPNDVIEKPSDEGPHVYQGGACHYKNGVLTADPGTSCSIGN